MSLSRHTIAPSTRAPKLSAKPLLARHDYDLILRNRLERRCIDVKMSHHQFGRRVGQPLRQRKILIVAALEQSPGRLGLYLRYSRCNATTFSRRTRRLPPESPTCELGCLSPPQSFVP